MCELFTWAIQSFQDFEKIQKPHSTVMTILPRQNRFRRISPATADLGGRSRLHHEITSGMITMRWALSGKRKSEKLLHDLSWFVDKLYELMLLTTGTLQAVMPSEVLEVRSTFVMRRATTPPVAGTPALTLTSDTYQTMSPLGIPESPRLPPPIGNDVLHLTGQSRAMRSRNEHRQLDPGFRRGERSMLGE